MSDYFIFGDIDTRNYNGIYVYFDNVDSTPTRVGDFVEVPGRNGAMFLDGGRYEDVTQTYDIIALTIDAGRNLINALASKVGHFRLQDSFNPTEYYSAVFTSEVDPNVTMQRDKISFKVSFTRKPQRFLTSGSTVISVTDGSTITNPTLFDARPRIQLTGAGTLTIEGTRITSTAPSGTTVYIDCDTMEIYRYNGSTLTNGSSLISFSTVDFPVLEPGASSIEISGVTDVKITPRWWKI